MTDVFSSVLGGSLPLIVDVSAVETSNLGFASRQSGATANTIRARGEA